MPMRGALGAARGCDRGAQRVDAAVALGENQLSKDTVLCRWRTLPMTKI